MAWECYTAASTKRPYKCCMCGRCKSQYGSDSELVIKRTMQDGPFAWEKDKWYCVHCFLGHCDQYYSQYGGSCRCDGCKAALKSAWGGQRLDTSNVLKVTPPGLQFALSSAASALPDTAMSPVSPVDELAKLKVEIEKIKEVEIDQIKEEVSSMQSLLEHVHELVRKLLMET